MKPIYILLFIWLCTLPLQAQKDSLLNREMILEKEYSPTIEPAVKINRLPELREPQAPKSKVAFSNYSTNYELQPGIVPLMPRSLFSDWNTSKYAGYASLGLSSALNFDGDAAYQILNTERDFLDVYFSHRSSNSDNPSLQEPSQKQKFYMNDNLGGANFTCGLDNLKLSAGLKYTRSSFNYSGDKNSPNQVNNMLEACAGIVSDAPNELNYAANVKYTRFRQKYLGQTTPGVKENRLIIDWDLHKNYDAVSKYGLSGAYKTYGYNSKTFRKLNDMTLFFVLSLTPYYYIEGDNLNLTLGVNANLEMGGRNKKAISPHIRFNYNPLDVLLFYASALGGRNDNSQYSMFYENRYVYPSIRVWDSRSLVDATVGAQYLPLSNLSLNVFAGYRLTKDEHFFTDTMCVRYGTANGVKLGAQVNYISHDLFGIDVKGTLYNWSVKDAGGNSFEAYHKPRFEAETDAFFLVPDMPLRLDLAFKGLFGRVGDSDYKMKDIYDLSIKANYIITPLISANLSVNNLLFQKYDIWYGYPAQKFNIMGGVSIKF
ncbi:MAG: TonB-dependent receptor [Dysgonamonadaceae bacterium]|jgi:hypothetical protein|nr:TonB-dependent receptor [Dysgonamonadaceae bacterium]